MSKVSVKDPYRAYRAAVTHFGNAREELVWASAAGTHSDTYIAAETACANARVQLNRTVEKLINRAKQGEMI